MNQFFNDFNYYLEYYADGYDKYLKNVNEILLDGYKKNIFKEFTKNFKKYEDIVDFDWSKIENEDFQLIQECIGYFEYMAVLNFKVVQKLNLQVIRLIFPLNISLKFIYYNNYEENSFSKLYIQYYLMSIVHTYYLKDLFKDFKKINIKSLFLQSPIEREIIRKINLKNEEWFDFTLYPGKVMNLKTVLLECLEKYGSFSFLKLYFDLFYDDFHIIITFLKSIYLLSSYGFFNYNENLRLLNNLLLLSQNLFLIEKEFGENYNWHRKYISKILIHIVLFFNDNKLLSDQIILKDIDKKGKKELNLKNEDPFKIEEINTEKDGDVTINDGENLESNKDLGQTFNKSNYVVLDPEVIEITYIQNFKNKINDFGIDIDEEEENNKDKGKNLSVNKSFFFENDITYQKILSIIFKFLTRSISGNELFNYDRNSEFYTQEESILHYINILMGLLKQLNEEEYLISINLQDTILYQSYLFNSFKENNVVPKEFYYEITELKNKLFYYNEDYDMVKIKELFQKLVENFDESIVLKLQKKESNKIVNNNEDKEFKIGDVEKHEENKAEYKPLKTKTTKDKNKTINKKELILFKLLENGSIENYLDIINELILKYPNVDKNEKKEYKNLIRRAIKQFRIIFKEKQFIKCLFAINKLEMLENIFNFLKYETCMEILILIKGYGNEFLFYDKTHTIFHFFNNRYKELLNSLDFKSIKSYFTNTIDFSLSKKKMKLIKTLLIFNSIFESFFKSSYKNSSYEKFDYLFQNTILPIMDLNNTFISYFFNDRKNNNFKDFDRFLIIGDYNSFDDIQNNHLILNYFYSNLKIFNFSIDTFIGKEVYDHYYNNSVLENMKDFLSVGNCEYKISNENIYYSSIGPLFRKVILKLFMNLFIFPTNRMINNKKEIFKNGNKNELQIIPEIYSKKEFFDLLVDEFKYLLIFKNYHNKTNIEFVAYIEDYLFHGYFPFIIMFIKGISKLIVQSNPRTFFFNFKHYFKKFIAQLQSNFETIKSLLKILDNDLINKKWTKINSLFTVLNDYLNVKEETFKSNLLNEASDKVKETRKKEQTKASLRIDNNQTLIKNIAAKAPGIKLDFINKGYNSKIYPELSNLRKSINYIINIISYIYEATDHGHTIKSYLDENDNTELVETKLELSILAQSYYDSKKKFYDDEKNTFKHFILKEYIIDKEILISFIKFIVNSINLDFEKNFFINKNLILKIDFLRDVITNNNNFKKILLDYVQKNNLIIKNVYFNFKKIVLFLIFKPFRDQSYLYLYKFFDCYRLFIQETCEDDFYQFKLFYDNVNIREDEEDDLVYESNKEEILLDYNIEELNDNEAIQEKLLQEINDNKGKEQLTILKDYFSLITLVFKYSNVSKNSSKSLVGTDRKDTFKLVSNLIYSFREFMGGNALKNNFWVLSQYDEIQTLKGILERNIEVLNSAFYNLKFETIQFFLYLIEGENKNICESVSQSLNIMKLYNNMIEMIKLIYLQNYNIEQNLSNNVSRYKKYNISAEKAVEKTKKDIESYKLKMLKNKLLDPKVLELKNKDLKKKIKILESLKKEEETINNYYRNIVDTEDDEANTINNSTKIFNYYINLPKERFSDCLIINICFSYFNIFQILKKSSKKIFNFLNEKELLLYTFKSKLKITFYGDNSSLLDIEDDTDTKIKNNTIEEDIYIYNFLFYIMKPIELINDGDLLIYYFPKKPESFFLRQEKKNDFLGNLSLETTLGNQKELMYNTDKFGIEMVHEYDLYIKHFYLYKVSNSHSLFLAKSWIWFLSLVQNIFLLFAYTRDTTSTTRNVQLKQQSYRIVISVFSYVILALSFWFVVIYMLGKMKIKYKIYEKTYINKKHWSKYIIIVLKSTIFNPEFIPLLLHFIFVILALTVSDFFISLHLFLLLFLNNVVKAVFESAVKHYDQLLLSFAFAVIIIFAYALILAQYYANGFIENELCTTIFYCVFNVINFGVRNGGGVSDTLNITQNSAGGRTIVGRFFFDFSFYFIINVIFLNIIQGIIVDTFSQKREKTSERDEKFNTICTICGLSRFNLEKHNIPFEHHISNKHSPFNYVDFVIYLNQKDKKEFNSLEYEIYELIEKEKYDWIPNGKTENLLDAETDIYEDLIDNFKTFNKIRLEKKSDKIKKLKEEEAKKIRFWNRDRLDEEIVEEEDNEKFNIEDSESENDVNFDQQE